MMGLWQMSFYGAVLILVILAVRAVAVNRLPKRTFVILWGIALIRLLVPFKVPSGFSVYSFVGYEAQQGITKNWVQDMGQGMQEVMPQDLNRDTQESMPGAGVYTEASEDAYDAATEAGQADRQGSFVWLWLFVRCIGTALWAAFFTVTYVRCRREFATSLPVQNEFVEQWLMRRRTADRGSMGVYRPWGTGSPGTFRFGRTVTARVSDRIGTPLTYGVFHPVILLPKKMDWGEREGLEYILWHEYMHIRYWDAALKLTAAAALCVHWFNPFVWAMYFLLNRDIELACDESVVRRCGVGSKSVYANMLIGMEARRSGLMPLYNNFSRNAIEERIRAIMNIKKISTGAVVFAAGLVVGVTTVFATSAPDRAGKTGQKNSVQENMVLEDGRFTQEEYGQLSALRFNGYEDMAVSEYQDRVWAMTDTVEYSELLERFLQDEALYVRRDYDDMAGFLFYVLAPLTGERWREREFGDYVSAGAETDGMAGDVLSDQASIEYFMILTILDADRLTVGEYVDTRLGVAEGMRELLKGRTAEELADKTYMQSELTEMVEELEEKWSTDQIRVDMEYVFNPIQLEDSADADWRKEIERQWERTLAPYEPFGLTWEYEADANEGKCLIYFQGRQVRGICDEYKGCWITEHAGVGEGVYGEDAIEVYAIYKDGRLTGLRAATEKEQEEWDLRRKKTTEDYYNEVLEVREYLPGTKEDYQSVLALKKAAYQQMPLADFNEALLDWGNRNGDAYDRIMCDCIWDDFRVSLSVEELDFVNRTVSLSGSENGAKVRSSYMGKPQEDVILQDDLTKSPGGDEAQYVWCHMYYSFSYHVSDEEQVTVGERDRCVGGMIDGIREFWEGTDIEELLKLEKKDIIGKLNELAQRHSSEGIAITVGREDQIGFECKDERSLMMEY